MPTPEAGALSAAQHGKIRRLSRPAEAAPGDEAGELNVVPFLDILMNVMMFVLASVTVAFASTITTSAEAGTRREAQPPEALRLTALVTAEGVALKTARGGIAPGCDGYGGGVTVPRRGGEIDLVGLGACARRIKGARAEYALETQVGITADPGVPYESVVAVMDALRSDAQGELFPEVRLGVVR